MTIRSYPDIPSSCIAQITHVPYLEDLYEAFSRCRIFVSTSALEGFGIAIAEALSLGIPVVAADASPGAVRYVLSASCKTWSPCSGLVRLPCGFLLPSVDHGNHPELVARLWANAISQVLQDPKLYEEMSCHALERGDEFSECNIRESWVSLVRNQVS